MNKRFKKLHFLFKKEQEYRGLNFQAQPIVFGWTRKFWKFLGEISHGRIAKTGGSDGIYGVWGYGRP